MSEQHVLPARRRRDARGTSDVRIGVDGAPLSIRRTGVGRYVGELLVAAAAQVADPASLRVLLYQPGRRNPPGSHDDLAAAGLSLRRMSQGVSRGVTAGIHLGLPVPVEGLLGSPDVMLYTRYWHGPRRRAATISLVYDLVFEVAPESVDPAYLPKLRRTATEAIERSDLVAVISHRMEAELHAAHPATVGRTVVLEPGPTRLPSPDADTAERAVRALGVEPGRFLLCVGTLQPRKNLVRLVEAMERVRPDVPLLLVGPRGWSDAPILAAIEASGGRVRHVPFVDDLTLAALYRTATALAFPSTYEGFGLPLLEALAAGTPVACSDIPVFREVGGSAVAHFDPTDPDDIAAVVSRLLAHDEERASLASCGPVRAADYAWERSGTRLVDAARALAAGAGSRP